MARYGRQSWAQRRWQPERMALYLFTVAGIRVSIHVFSLVLLFFETLSAAAIAKAAGASIPSALGMLCTIAGLLFLFVLLHEFGHCLSCRAVGGTADDILMWPLGGLASCDPPDRPWENLITTVCGPLVNLAICAILFPFLVYNGVPALTLLNPFGEVWRLYATTWWPIAFTFQVNYWLFLFNVLLPVYPMDGGRILQEILWFRLGKNRATRIACNVGMFVAAIVGAVSLYNQNLWMFGIMAFCFIHCYQTLQFINAVYYEQAGAFGYDFSEGYKAFDRDEDERPPKKPSFLQRWRAKREAKNRQTEADFEREIDRILAKLHDEGLASLTNREKRLLNEASERQRKRGPH